MGMRAHYVELDSDDMSNIMDNPDSASELLMGGGMGGMDMQSVLGVLGVKESDYLKAIQNLPGVSSLKKPPAKAAAKKNRPQLQIEKSWQAIHFVLNGDPWKGKGLLNNAVLGGKEVGDDMGYGPARYLDPFVVVQTSTALDRISDEEFSKKVRAADFAGNDIYVYDRHSGPEDLEELGYYFTQIRAFFKAAADKGHGILLGII